MFVRALTILAFLPLGSVLAQPCMTAYTSTANPQPVGGSYGCDQTVTFCFTVTNWNSTNSNWFHGIEANFGPGWDLSTLVPGTPPATCGAAIGTWGWYANVSGQGPGFFFDLNANGNPADNFGDFCIGATNWQFCWTITTLSGAACVSGLDCNVAIDTFSDSQTGSWGSNGCSGDPNPLVFPGPVVIAACNVNPGIGGPLSVCNTSAAVGLFASLGGTPELGGAWTGPGGGAHTGTLMPGVDVSGNYTYTVTSVAPPCSQSAVIAVTVVQQPLAGSNGSATACALDAPFPLFSVLGGSPSIGGTWTGPGGPSNGTFNPATDPAGVYTYSFPGTAPCAPASSNATISVNPAPNAGTNGTVAFCSNGTTQSLFSSLGGMPNAGGTWTGPGGGMFSGNYSPVLNAPGVFTYTVLGAAPCANASATVTVSETNQPVAGNNASISLCITSAPINMTNSLGGTPNSGGTWTGPGGTSVPALLNPSTASSGVYTYTVTGTAPCSNALALLTVTIVPAANAGGNGIAELCSASGPVPLIQYLTGMPDPGGAWTGFNNTPANSIFTPGTSIPGTYTYTVPGTPPCANAMATVSVSVSPQPSAGADAATSMCNTGPSVALFGLLGGSPVSGGSWSGPNGNMVPSTLNPSTALSGIYTYTVTSIAPCSSDQALVDVTIHSEPDPGMNGAITLCTASSPTDLFLLLGGTPDFGGTWQGPSGPVSGSFNPTSGPAGTYTYSVPATAPCIAQSANVVVDLVVQPDPGGNAVATLCNSSMTPLNLFGALTGAPDMGGVWTAPNGQPHSEEFDPSGDVAGIYTYSLNAQTPCTNVTSSVTISIVQSPDAGNDQSISLCEDVGMVDPFSWLGPNIITTGVWRDPIGAVIVSVNPSTALSGNFTYTLAGIAPCTNDAATFAVQIDPLPNAGVSGALDLCANAASQALLNVVGPAAGTNGVWTGPQGITSGIFDTGTDPAGTYTYTVLGINGCSGRNSSSTVDIQVNENPTPSFTAGISSGCVPLQIPFTIDASLVITNASWTFGDGSSGTSIGQALHTYTNAGSFSVTLEVVDSNGCHGSITRTDLVLTSDGPDADFTALPQRVSVLVPDVVVTHLPLNDVSYVWMMDGDTVAGAANFIWNIDPPMIGEHPICLIATDALGCSNSICTEILVDDALTIFVPNAFTPDGNDLNEEFLPSVLGADPASYSFAIFDRWGIEVFRSNEIGQGWNGAKNNSGKLLPEDVYVWRLTVRDQFTAESVERFGTVTLLK